MKHVTYMIMLKISEKDILIFVLSKGTCDIFYNILPHKEE